jgi:hypothetical protein
MRQRPVSHLLAAMAPLWVIGLTLMTTAPAAAQAPRIELRDPSAAEGEFLVENLPAVSADSRYIAHAYVGEDGARANPNLLFEVRRVEDDGLVWRFEVLSPADDVVETLEHLVGRLQAVQSFLAQHTWQPLIEVPVATMGDEDHPELTQATVPGSPELDLLAARDRLLLASGLGGPVQVIVTHWAPPPLPDDDPECLGVNVPSVRRVWASADQSLLLVRVGFFGHDMCWEPEPEYHVVKVTLPTGGPSCEVRGGTCMEGCEAGHRNIGPQGCFDSICCVPEQTPVRCAQVPEASCQQACEGDAMALVPRAFCAGDARCCGPPQ